jgi:hypothetical protein
MDFYALFIAIISLSYIIKFKSDEQKHLHEWNSVYLRPYNDCQGEREILLYDLSLPLLPFVVMIIYQESITAVGEKIPGPDAGISFALKSQNWDGERKL